MIAYTIALLVLRHIFPSLASSECTDINNCRTFSDIIEPAVTALFAANYLSVHGNISRPNLPWYWKAYDSAKLFLVSLIFPDWIFMWAIRSWIAAFTQSAILEEARQSAYAKWGHLPNATNTPKACKSQ